jgi:hypothetical protein
MSVKVMKLSTRTVHFVDASGNADSGSLYGFFTFCGLRIEDINAWDERQGVRRFITCGSCARSQHGRKRHRRERELQAMLRKLREQEEELQRLRQAKVNIRRINLELVT